jgi:hypothetical protein
MAIGPQIIHHMALCALLIKIENYSYMKIVLTLLFLTAPFVLAAQSNQEKSSLFLADKLRDSLLLSAKQHQELYTVNLIIEEEKKNIRSLYDDPYQLRKKVQNIENKRDSLYQEVFNAEQFILYKNRKSTLLNVSMNK